MLGKNLLKNNKTAPEGNIGHIVLDNISSFALDNEHDWARAKIIKNILNLVKLSIIIPVKNRAHIIEQTINSILSTNYPELEIIVIDNNSKNETEKIIKNYDNIIYVKNNH